MLPALSSISTRSEMRPLAEQLASAFTTIAIDWPGLGDRPRRAIAWEPDAYRKFLQHSCRNYQNQRQRLRPVTLPGTCSPTLPNITALSESCVSSHLHGAGRCQR